MVVRSALCVITIVGMAVAGLSGAEALTAKECSVKYQAAKAAGTLDGAGWNEFRKAQCGKDAEAAPASAALASATPATSAAAPAASGSAVFPSAVAAKFASEKPAQARMHTCLEQYHANKATNSNGGLTWIQKGGGYYSECNKRLKT